MRRALLLCLFSFSALCTRAQLGMNAGLAMTKYKYTNAGISYKRSREFSYTAGISCNLMHARLSLRPALEYAPIITKVDAAGLGTGILYYRNRLNYIRLALPVLLNFGDREHGQWTGVQVGAGPYMARLLSASSTAHDLDDNERKIPFEIGSAGNDDFRPEDIGLQLYFGVKVAHFVASFTDNLGYHNASPAAGSRVMMRSFVLGMGIEF